ncbi:crossover junction endodeoxyribonuclease RuvC [Methylobacterium aerolatum]|uniref:Crossover junction endodeoxyribonuclease RuvC n=1 Tax=Methylobacterium aerolatum TaxID=418708 RepID=A0ABU0HYU0_9HYPH|nr:crossover junction endodeoxyribonuclease RuvC [Methylobacterium aerolatum]MDQ0446651.1 crossover junction endodeoxyribonuclease RuvC [Methylobacterium aerolatum]GJD33618.1 Crossover junction endodeoxyribonuclease RuvC [Methylobacterium aerolatum]
MSEPVRILGIDPGLRRTGWGLITARGTALTYHDCGIVTSNGDLPLALRLRELFDGLGRICEALKPDEVAVEETFVNKDAQATLKLGHARAVALLVPALAEVPVFEYAANLIKKTVAGSGHAEKAQIQAMVRFLLPKAEFRVADAADALAIAVTHASHRGAHALKATLQPGRERRSLVGVALAGQGLEGQGYSAAAAARIEAALAKAPPKGR